MQQGHCREGLRLRSEKIRFTSFPTFHPLDNNVIGAPRGKWGKSMQTAPGLILQSLQHPPSCLNLRV